MSPPNESTEIETKRWLDLPKSVGRGLVSMPLAAIVMMLELAHHVDALMVPLLLAVTEATVVARRLGAPSIYSARLSGRNGEPARKVPEESPLGWAEPATLR